MANKPEASPKIWHILVPAAATVLVALIGLFTAVYQTEKPIQLTQAAQSVTLTAASTLKPSEPAVKTIPATLPAKVDLPAASPTPPGPAVQITNNLYLPVKILINAVDKGELDSETAKTYVLENYPASITWSVVKETTAEGTPLGDPMGGTFTAAKPGDKINIINLVGDQPYFYPIITNPTPADCEVTINKGWKSENITHAVVSAKTERVGMGYYLLFSNSNVTLDCSGEIYWWGAQPDETNPDPFFKEVNSSNGVIEFTLKP